MQQYSKTAYLRKAEAEQCQVQSTLLLPLFISPRRSGCVGVLEVVQTSEDMAFADVAMLLAAALEVRFLSCEQACACRSAAWPVHSGWGVACGQDAVRSGCCAGCREAACLEQCSPGPSLELPLPQKCELYTCEMDAVHRHAPSAARTATFMLPPQMGVLAPPPQGNTSEDDSANGRGSDAAAADCGTLGGMTAAQGGGGSGGGADSGDGSAGACGEGQDNAGGQSRSGLESSCLHRCPFHVAPSQLHVLYHRPADDDDDDAMSEDEGGGGGRHKTGSGGSKGGGKHRRKGMGNPGEPPLRWPVFKLS